MMKALTYNIQQEREDQRDRSAQLFMWCIVVSMHQDDGIGASRLLRACNEMDAFEKKYQTAILYGSSKTAIITIATTVIPCLNATSFLARFLFSLIVSTCLGAEAGRRCASTCARMRRLWTLMLRAI